LVHLRIIRLSKEFRLMLLAGKRIFALRDVCLEVEEGSFVALVGPSGAGKSTLLKCIYRTYVPSLGQIWYRSNDGWIDLAALDERRILALRRREIGYVSQFFKPLPRVSSLDWVARPLTMLGRDIRQAREEAAALLGRLNIRPELWDAFPVMFSGGEQQRINLARALIVPRRLLLLDEPTASLDSTNQATVLDLLAEVRKRGTTMIGVFHNPDSFAPLVDCYYRMSGGQVAETWAPDRKQLAVGLR